MNKTGECNIGGIILPEENPKYWKLE